MSRAKYCIEQAALCRNMAQQMSSRTDVERLRDMAARYEAEAKTLQDPPTQQQQPQAMQSKQEE
jgi:hypothetical protein